ncbi:hypothetical protein MKX01_038207 [Papaver californicum]|nr:hypothetical protein MKX01_038207 [Papaver californicum]
MKDGGKAVAVAVAVASSSNWFTTDYSSYSDLPCKKHPSSSSAGGICAYCLKDRLIKLVCSDCGEQRLSSCSCSDISSSYTSAEVGSVGRISFLIENEKELDINNHIPHSTGNININNPIRSESSTVILKRSSSNCVDVKRNGFWRFGRLFRKKGEKGSNGVEFREGASVTGGGFDEKSEMWVFHNVGSVPRSRSLCGFRGGFDASENGSTVGGMPDSKRAGDTESANRKRGFIHGVGSILDGSSAGKNIGVESESGSGSSMKNDNISSQISESVAFTGFKNDRVMEFNGDLDHDSGFIDLKLGFSSESKTEFSCLKNSHRFETESGFRVSKDSNFSGHESDSFSYLRGERIFSNGSSCRITVNEKEINKCRKSLKIWKWIFKNHSTGARTVCKKHGKHCIRS